MKTVVAICTEKTTSADIDILDTVINRSRQQGADEIIVVENYPQPLRKHNDVTYLHVKKQNAYELCRCANTALDYLEQQYLQDFTLFCAADDWIPAGDYMDKMRRNLARAHIHHPSGHYIRLPLDRNYESNFVPDCRLRCSVPSLEFMIDHLESIGDDLILGGIIAFIFDERARGLRFDSAYDGAWGYEDTDYILQLLAAGYRVIPVPDAHLWIVTSSWKCQNHQTCNHRLNISDNKNALYFQRKWRQKIIICS